MSPSVLDYNPADASTSHAAGVGADASDFHGFLKALDTDCKKKLERLSKPDEELPTDPLIAAIAGEKEKSERRHANAKARMAEIDRRSKAETGYEGDWREQVQRRKEAERRRVVEEAAAAAAALEAARRAEQEEAQAAADNTPLAVARRNWAANDSARRAARANENAAYEEGVRAWLDEDWLPRLEDHRQQLRRAREAEERQYENALLMLQWERDSMTREDAAVASFTAAAFAECEQRSVKMRLEDEDDPALQAVVHGILVAKAEEKWQAEEREKQQRQAEEALRLKEEERQKAEYKEWKQEVRNNRCRRKRLEDQNDAEFHERGLSEQLSEKMTQQAIEQTAALEDALQRATADASRLQQSGMSPRRVLEETRNQATFEKKQRVHQEPAKLEQEAWEIMLAKNRHARQQERSGPRSARTPRWGIFS